MRRATPALHARPIGCALLCATLCAWLAPTAPAQVVLRDGGRIETVLGVSVAGVRARAADGQASVISWDRVRSVEGEHADSAAEFTPLAQRAWRARTRLARGDTALAAPVFEQLFAELAHEAGATPLLAAEGALACRLALGDMPGAVEAHLRARGLRAAGAILPSDVWSARLQSALPPVLDANTDLAPALSPLLLLPGSRGAQEVWMLTERMQGDDPLLLSWRLVSGALSGMATQAQLNPLRRALDRPYDAWEDQLLRDAALALAGATAQRAKAQRNLADRLATAQGDWVEAWRRLAIGRSQVLEDDLGVMRQGAIHLLHVPARFAAALPRHAGVALALSADALHRLGDDTGAFALREALARAPASPAALAWLDARLRADAANDANHADASDRPMPKEPHAAFVRRRDVEMAIAAQEGARL